MDCGSEHNVTDRQVPSDYNIGILGAQSQYEFFMRNLMNIWLLYSKGPQNESCTLNNVMNAHNRTTYVALCANRPTLSTKVKCLQGTSWHIQQYVSIWVPTHYKHKPFTQKNICWQAFVNVKSYVHILPWDLCEVTTYNTVFHSFTLLHF